MREKIADFFYAFCISAGGVSVALLYPVDLVGAVAIALVSVGAGIFFVHFDTDARRHDFLSVGALFSSAVSLWLGVTLVTDFTLDNSFVPICLFLSFVVAVAIAFSSDRASKSVASAMSVIAITLLLVIFLLCVLESDFSTKITVSNDKKILFPLAIFSVFDTVFILPSIKKKNRIFCLFGGVLMPLYLVATVAITLFALPHNVYFGPVTPIIKMWQTCFVLSFIDRFETLIICVIFAINVLKSGILLKTALCKIKKPLIFIPALLAVALIFRPALIYVFAIFTAIFVLIYLLFKKTY